MSLQTSNNTFLCSGFAIGSNQVATASSYSLSAKPVTDSQNNPCWNLSHKLLRLNWNDHGKNKHQPLTSIAVIFQKNTMPGSAQCLVGLVISYTLYQLYGILFWLKNNKIILNISVILFCCCCFIYPSSSLLHFVWPDQVAEHWIGVVDV